MARCHFFLLSEDLRLQRDVSRLVNLPGVEVTTVGDPEEARQRLGRELCDCLLVDARYSAGLGLAIVLGTDPTSLGLAGPVPPWVAIVPDGDPEVMRRAAAGNPRDMISLGSLEGELLGRVEPFVPKPLLRSGQRRHVQTSLPERQATRGRPFRMRKGDVLVGHSPAMLRLVEQMDMLAKADIGVAIYGETGTGKELVARTLHAMSPRAAKPFIVANCTALPEPLFENELFGHEKGAYTGADRKQPGLLQEAERGTLLLDEIGDAPLGIQAKLLRLLQFREYKTVGGVQTLKADVRILTTTHRDLRDMVSKGSFREDLYYRMSTLEIWLPALRERMEDIPLLAAHFVEVYNEDRGRDFEGLTPAAIAKLQAHSWPGNVRELESVVKRGLVMAGTASHVDGVHIDLAPAARGQVLDLKRPYAELRDEMLARFEVDYLRALLARARGNLSEAARLAQHERKSLWLMCRRHALDPAEFRTSR
jgi:two-component system response regulator GlrR